MKSLMATICLLIAAGAIAQTLPSEDAGLFEGAGIPVYSGADFVYGNSQLGFRFATSEAPAVVRKWYLVQLEGWSLMDDMGLWILYDGPAGLGFADIMSLNQVTVSTNDELPNWHSLDKSMTTEIVVQLAK